MKRDPLPFPVAPDIAQAEPMPHAWRIALPALAVALIAIVADYASTAAGIVRIWANSETFAHGFVVLPISLWLIWRMRSRLRTFEPAPSWRALPLLAAAGLAWLVGAAGAVNALMHAAFVAMIILSVPAILGWRVARAMMFPLGFLLFAVPFGEFLLPALMDRTADFTVAALRASGVPVFRDGLLIVLPTGRWSIVEACSGVRYLIASLMAGTLFAYLTYTANWRRWVFVGVSLVVPIIANWLRAYLIVLLGHLSNNRLAAGVDHLIYGWVFFGLVMLLMFWIGARWQEQAAAEAPRATAIAAAGGTRAAPARFRVASLAVIAVTLVWPLFDRALQPEAADRTATLGAIDVPGWQAMPPANGDFTPRFNAPNATRQQTFARDGVAAGLYVAYYRGQTPQRKLVSSENMLVRSEDKAWLKLAESVSEARIAGMPRTVTATRVQAAGGRTLVAWRWYWIDGTLTSSDALAAARLTWSRLTGRGDASAAIVVYAPVGDGAQADDTLQRFIDDAWPGIAAALEKVRDRR